MMDSLENHTVVAGVDVGGVRKGFHFVVLRGKKILEAGACHDPRILTARLGASAARAVAVDAPSGWSDGGGSREAERQLARRKMPCHPTPTRETAQTRAFNRWTLNGERLFQALAEAFPLFSGRPTGAPACFETFPHAIACRLSGKIVPAADKNRIRRGLLRALGIDLDPLTRIDLVDAALCALAAQAFLSGRIEVLGNRIEGYIIIPSAGS